MITVILPTYNSIQFLKERVDTICNQTFGDWECIVIDGFSTDGTFEYLSTTAKKDSRFNVLQFEPKGVYNAWNIGLKHSKGQYIYFATSDDTMSTDCLEIMHMHLLNNKDCSMVHCNLSIIDTYSKPIENLDWNTFPAQHYFGELTHNYHIRKAPLCGLLYFTHQTVIHSFTQLLIRASVFNSIGMFLENEGVEADLEWGMRATLSENLVHVPKKLATWRVHKDQLTTLKPSKSSINNILSLQKMAINNANISNDLRTSILKRMVKWQGLSFIKSYRFTSLGLRLCSLAYWKVKFQLPKSFKVLATRPNLYFDLLFKELIGEEPYNFIVKKHNPK